MKKLAICVAIGSFGLLCVHAQTIDRARSINPVSPSFGILVGTGVGLTYYQPVGRQFSVQAGASFMPFHTKIVGAYGEYETRSRVNAQIHNVHLLLGWMPFHGTGNFMRHFTINAGAAYLLRAEGSIGTHLNEPYYYGDIRVPQSMIGEVNTTVNWEQSVAPYFGIGLTNVRIDDRFGFNVGVGGYYLPSPSVSMKGTKLLAHNEANGPIIERNIKNYRLLPQIQLGVNYRLRML